jgi:hypothetical protein
MFQWISRGFEKGKVPFGKRAVTGINKAGTRIADHSERVKNILNIKLTWKARLQQESVRFTMRLGPKKGTGFSGTDPGMYASRFMQGERRPPDGIKHHAIKEMGSKGGQSGLIVKVGPDCLVAAR